MTQSKSKKIKLAIVSVMLVACLAVAGISAYFTDGADVTNTFTIGEVNLDLTEPSYPGNDDPEVKDITPNAEIEKDPTITNTGKNDEYVFLTVTVPYAENLVVANAAGEKQPAAAELELFSYTLNDGWTQVGQVVQNKTDKTNTYIYAYGSETKLTVLPADDDTSTQDVAENITPALFDSVTFVNAVEGQGLENKTKEIAIKAYGIQADNLTSDAPSTVWNIIVNQREVVIPTGK